MVVPDKILELVGRFSSNLESYKQSKYNETQVRREFIDPLLEELGWDVANKQGYAEAYKEVVHEDVVKIGGATKAKVPPIKTLLQRQIETTDHQIDQLVYKLYGLTKEEIKIVEGSSG